MSNIEAVPQPRIDLLALAVDDPSRHVRRTEYRGTVWYGGRPRLAAWGTESRAGSTAGISTPFWVPDSLAYRAGAAQTAVVSAGAALQSTPTGGQIIEVNASLEPHPGRPGLAFVLVRLQAVGAVPLGVSYQVAVLVDPDQVAD